VAGVWQVASGECQGFADATYKYPRFYKYMQASGYDNDNNRALELVELDFNNPIPRDASYVDGSGITVTQTRDFAVDTYNANGEVVKRSEMTNFANWFAYYRTRILAAKTAASRAFANLDSNYRVGSTSSTARRLLAPVNDFDVGGTARPTGIRSYSP